MENQQQNNPNNPSTQYYYPPINPGYAPQILENQPAFIPIQVQYNGQAPSAPPMNDPMQMQQQPGMMPNNPNQMYYPPPASPPMGQGQPMAPGMAPAMVPPQVEMHTIYNAPPPPTNYVNVSAFEINEAQAKQIFTKWRDERWFAPSDFRDLKEGQLYAFLVPYYQFNTTINVQYSGKIGYNQTHTTNSVHVSRNTPTTHTQSTATTTSWHPAQSQATVNYPSLLICASLVDHDANMLSRIGNWNLSKVVCTPSYQDKLGPSKDWESCWKKALANIQMQERNKAGPVLRKETGADVAENTAAKLNIAHLEYKLLYFPVYYYGYTYKEKEYKFFINGQNGAREGERPYGLGMIGRGLDKIGGFVKGIFTSEKTEEEKRVDEWKKLQQPGNEPPQ